MGFGTPISRVRRSSKVTTFVANNTTVSMAVFTVTGAVIVYRIWGVVTTTIGANHTAGHLRTNDQTATIDLTLNTGITLSALAVGTLVSKIGLAADALTLDDNATAKITEAASAGQLPFSPVIIVKKTGATTTVDYRYSTTDAPTSGAVTWYADWEPLSADGNLV